MWQLSCSSWDHHILSIISSYEDNFEVTLTTPVARLLDQEAHVELGPQPGSGESQLLPFSAHWEVNIETLDLISTGKSISRHTNRKINMRSHHQEMSPAHLHGWLQLWRGEVTEDKEQNLGRKLRDVCHPHFCHFHLLLPSETSRDIPCTSFPAKMSSSFCLEACATIEGKSWSGTWWSLSADSALLLSWNFLKYEKQLAQQQGFVCQARTGFNWRVCRECFWSVTMIPILTRYVHIFKIMRWFLQCVWRVFIICLCMKRDAGTYSNIKL